jgi:heme/copper-type cytochrome/quinol oxidase subunit 3
VTNTRKLDFHTPRRAYTIGMWLFLAALGMLFFAGMLMYVLFFVHVFGSASVIPVHLPALTWLSTLVLLGASYTIHRAVAAVRRERQAELRKWLYTTTALALVFLIVQTPCMIEIYRVHSGFMAVATAETTGKVKPIPLDGLVFCLILVHALHVIGGIVALLLVTAAVYRGRYDHEEYMGIQHTALYWHFLDAVWLVMFATFMVTG